MSDVLFQGIGFIGVFLFVLSYQFKSNRMLLICQISGSCMFILQFVLLGAYIGAVNLIITLVRNLLVMNRERFSWARSWWLCAGLIGTGLVFLVLFWNGPMSVLPFMALAGSTLGYWTGSAQYIRLSNLICASPCWLSYDLLVGSWGGVACEIITVVSALISIYRYGWKELAAI